MCTHLGGNTVPACLSLKQTLSGHPLVDAPGRGQGHLTCSPCPPGALREASRETNYRTLYPANLCSLRVSVHLPRPHVGLFPSARQPTCTVCMCPGVWLQLSSVPTGRLHT